MSNFIRLNITAEGQTEERFIKRVLANHFGSFNISTDVRIVLTSKGRYKQFRGGLINYQKAKNDIETWLKYDNNDDAYFTTMFDYYALPNDFPGFADSLKINNIYERITFLENSFYSDINDKRFTAYIQLHEFEALLFSKPEILETFYFNRLSEINKLKIIAQKIGNPELINDHPKTSPSKRILNLIPEFDKANIGAIAAGEIGIDTLRNSCKHFNEWISKLESLSNNPKP
jgi:hypothetical protein